MGHMEIKHAPKDEKRSRGPGKLLVEYVSITGSIFLLVNAGTSMNWREAASMVTNPTGQAVLVLFGGVVVYLLWIVERFRR